MTDGASPSEILLDAARRNNMEQLESVLGGGSALINESRDPLGNTALHLAASSGAYDTLDLLLDQEGVEVDPRNRINGDTPLHVAARAIPKAPEVSVAIIDMLIDAGSDVKAENKEGLKPSDLVGETDAKWGESLKAAEMALLMGDGEYQVALAVQQCASNRALRCDDRAIGRYDDTKPPLTATC